MMLYWHPNNPPSQGGFLIYNQGHMSERDNERKREMARRYVAQQERNQREERESAARKREEIHNRHVEGVHRHMYDRMSKEERKEWFGKE